MTILIVKLSFSTPQVEQIRGQYGITNKAVLWASILLLNYRFFNTFLSPKYTEY